MPQKLKSRKFILALATVLAMLITAWCDVELDPEQVAAIIAPVIAYVFGEAWVDNQRQKGK